MPRFPLPMPLYHTNTISLCPRQVIRQDFTQRMWLLDTNHSWGS